MDLALRMFVSERGSDLASRGLYRNFVLHVCNLYEYGVVGQAAVFRAVEAMQSFMRDKGVTLDEGAFRAQMEKARKKNKGSNGKGRRDFSGIFKSEKAAK